MSYCRNALQDVLQKSNFWPLNRSVSRREICRRTLTSWQVNWKYRQELASESTGLVAQGVCFDQEFEFRVFTMRKWLGIAYFLISVFSIRFVFPAISRKKIGQLSTLEFKSTFSVWSQRRGSRNLSVHIHTNFWQFQLFPINNLIFFPTNQFSYGLILLPYWFLTLYLFLISRLPFFPFLTNQV